jgi:hypothetical protein
VFILPLGRDLSSAFAKLDDGTRRASHGRMRILLAWLTLGSVAMARPRVEVAFVLDATGSMQPWINAARERIDAIASDLAAGDPPPDVRFALVSYRDKGDAYLTRKHDFTRELPIMRGWLHNTEADGGGDTPEAVLEGLKTGIVELDWSVRDQSAMKLLYLVGDAPPHHYADSPTEAWLAAEALKRGIVLHTVACGGMDEGGQRFFEEMARRTEGRPFRLADAMTRKGRPSLGAVVSSSARAYSSAVGVDYKPTSAPVVIAPLSVAPLGAPSGLLGAALRRISDASAMTDLWAAHSSLAWDGKRMAAPRVDWAKQELLVLGGEDEGLELVALTPADGARIATVRAASPGPRFVLVPADARPIVIKGASR